MAEPNIEENFRRLRREAPDDVTIVCAAKTRTADEVAAAIEAGATVIGENYVQEAERCFREMEDQTARSVRWDLIGHLQRNKVNRALRVFDLVQSLDSLRLARALSKRVEDELPVYVQVNVAGEESKYGIEPEETGSFLEQVSQLGNLRVQGLMTMEPYFDDPEQARPYLRRMKEIYDEMAQVDLPNVELKTLSMGMTNSWRVAVEEGASMVRIGTGIFGPRD